jgi:hypothetical protein
VRSSGVPAVADFAMGAGGSRAVFQAGTIHSMTFDRQTTIMGELSPAPVDLSWFDLAPGAIGSIAFGRFQSPDFMVHPGEYIPEIASRTGVPQIQGVNIIDFNVTLPSGQMPRH